MKAYEPDMKMFGKKLRDLRLEGEYPDTVIAISFTRTDGEERTIEFPIWSFKASDGSPDFPENVAMIIGTNSYEPP